MSKISVLLKEWRRSEVTMKEDQAIARYPLECKALPVPNFSAHSLHLYPPFPGPI